MGTCSKKWSCVSTQTSPDCSILNEHCNAFFRTLKICHPFNQSLPFPLWERSQPTSVSDTHF